MAPEIDESISKHNLKNSDQAPEPLDEMLQALAVCKEWYHNDHFFQYSSSDQVMWQICQYIMVRFPDEFTPDK